MVYVLINMLLLHTDLTMSRDICKVLLNNLILDMQKILNRPVVVGVAIEKAQKEKLRTIARKQGIKLSDIVRQLIQEYLNHHDS